jgi:hypothetical protein
MGPLLRFLCAVSSADEEEFEGHSWLVDSSRPSAQSGLVCFSLERCRSVYNTLFWRALTPAYSSKVDTQGALKSADNGVLFKRVVVDSV